MKIRVKYFWIVLVIFACTVIAGPLPLPGLNLAWSAASQNNPAVVEAGAEVKLLADGFSFTEGPAVDREGNVYFTDQPNNRILKWSIDNELSTFLQPAGRSNGMYFDGIGNLLTCADEKNELWSVSPQKEVTVLLDSYDEKLLNGPNDLWIHPQTGWIYFTDPFYKRGYWTREAREQDVEGVYLFNRDRTDLIRIADDLEQPNGIVGTPDGKTLFVADIRAGVTFQYSIQEDGRLSEKREFCKMGSDGMTIDNEGNLYLTGRGVTVFSKNGEHLGQIKIDEGWTANVCFGGKDFRTLFITAMDSLYSIRMKTQGVR